MENFNLKQIDGTRLTNIGEYIKNKGYIQADYLIKP